MLTSAFTQGCVTDIPREVLKGEMPLLLKLLFELVHMGILMRVERRYQATFRDMGLAYATDLEELIDWPSMIIRHMARIYDPTPAPHRLAFGNLLTYVF